MKKVSSGTVPSVQIRVILIRAAVSQIRPAYARPTLQAIMDAAALKDTTGGNEIAKSFLKFSAIFAQVRQAVTVV